MLLPTLLLDRPSRFRFLQVLTNPVTLAYLALSGLAGLGLTFYYNNTENRRAGGAGWLTRHAWHAKDRLVRCQPCVRAADAA